MIQVALALLAKYWKQIAVGLAVIGVALMVWRWDANRLERAREEGREELRPQLVACAADRDTAIAANKEAEAAIKTLRAAYGELEDAVKMLEARERAARLRGERLKAELAKKEREFLEEAARLQAIIEGPRASSREEACAGAEMILTKEARERVGRIKQ